MIRYINADEAKKDLDERGFDFFTSEQDINEAKRWLDEQPAQNVEPVKHGHWAGTDNYAFVVCSVCRSYWVDRDEKYDFKYCPNCGAKMDEEKDTTI